MSSLIFSKAPTPFRKGVLPKDSTPTHPHPHSPEGEQEEEEVVVEEEEEVVVEEEEVIMHSVLYVQALL